jgi:DNA-binding CsgD family transcriptional regulator
MTYEQEVTGTGSRWNDVPSSVGGTAEAVLGARGEARRLQRIFERTPVPALMVDAQRRHLEANRPARLWFRRSLEEIRTYALGDLAPPDQLACWERLWARLLETGFVAERYQGTKPDGSPIDVFYCALADVLPGRHVVVFAPADWPEHELGVIQDDGPDPSASLTPREVEILTLAGESLSVQTIAESLTISAATVKTHLEHIYRKLGVHDRTAAVVHALRAGIIE